MTNDLVSDMLTRIRNASLAKHSFTCVNYSKLNLAILNVLKGEGYIKEYSLEKNEIDYKVLADELYELEIEESSDGKGAEYIHWIVDNLRNGNSR